MNTMPEARMEDTSTHRAIGRDVVAAAEVTGSEREEFTKQDYSSGWARPPTLLARSRKASGSARSGLIIE
jgi:hypothetical protein